MKAVFSGIIGCQATGLNTYGPCSSRPAGLFLFFEINNLAAFVEAAGRANGMGQAHLTAVGAGHQVAGRERIMGAPAIATSLGMLALWMWGHGLTPVCFL